jgi:hypothetical protein
MWSGSEVDQARGRFIRTQNLDLHNQPGDCSARRTDNAASPTLTRRQFTRSDEERFAPTAGRPTK